MGSIGAKRTVESNSRPLAETWKENVPESATPAQMRALDELFNYLDRSGFNHNNLEYTEFEVTALDSGDHYMLPNQRKQSPTLSVRYTLERRDRAENSLLNSWDSVYGNVLIGPRGGLYSYDGNGNRENLSYLDATSRISIEQRDERNRKQWERRRNK